MILLIQITNIAIEEYVHPNERKMKLRTISLINAPFVIRFDGFCNVSVDTWPVFTEKTKKHDTKNEIKIATSMK